MTKEQAFLANGEIANGVSFERHELIDHSDFLIGTVHIWVWRKELGGAEVLIQKRSLSKAVKPGMLDISAAGHIDEGEATIDAAIREAQEEIGLIMEKDKLEFAFRLRKTNVANCIAAVYLYEVDSLFEPEFDDGEVESAHWYPMNEFRELLSNPEAHDFSNHGKGYFTLLLERLEIAQDQN